MKTLVIASANKHKIEEFKSIFSDYNVLSLSDIGFSEDIAETGKTLEENSSIKAKTILKFCKAKKLDYAIVADDSGMFVKSLGGEPGIYSARYSGDHNDEANRQKVLLGLCGKTDRTAYFECALCYACNDEIKIFIGRTHGKITEKKIGNEAFGYDCIFYSDDLEKTFGEASEEEKNSVSHRGRAVEKLKIWLKENK